MPQQTIGILGSGIVGRTLADGFLAKGYDVMIGTRSTEKLDEWKAEAGPKAKVGGLPETAAFGDLLVLAVKGSAAKEALEQCGPGLHGKVMIDATNPIGDTPPEDGVLHFFTSLDRSLMEELQQAFPATRLVKAFNSIGSAHMIKPEFKGGPPSMFICGNEPSAKEQVAEICQMFGFEPVDMGSAVAARAIEPLCMLWCIPGFRENDWSHAFKLLRK